MSEWFNDADQALTNLGFKGPVHNKKYARALLKEDDFDDDVITEVLAKRDKDNKETLDLNRKYNTDYDKVQSTLEKHKVARAGVSKLKDDDRLGRLNTRTNIQIRYDRFLERGNDDPLTVATNSAMKGLEGAQGLDYAVFTRGDESALFLKGQQFFNGINYDEGHIENVREQINLANDVGPEPSAPSEAELEGKYARGNEEYTPIDVNPLREHLRMAEQERNRGVNPLLGARPDAVSAALAQGSQSLPLNSFQRLDPLQHPSRGREIEDWNRAGGGAASMKLSDAFLEYLGEFGGIARENLGKISSAWSSMINYFAVPLENGQRYLANQLDRFKRQPNYREAQAQQQQQQPSQLDDEFDDSPGYYQEREMASFRKNLAFSDRFQAGESQNNEDRMNSYVARSMQPSQDHQAGAVVLGHLINTVTNTLQSYNKDIIPYGRVRAFDTLGTIGQSDEFTPEDYNDIFKKTNAPIGERINDAQTQRQIAAQKLLMKHINDPHFTRGKNSVPTLIRLLNIQSEDQFVKFAHKYYKIIGLKPGQKQEEMGKELTLFNQNLSEEQNLDLADLVDETIVENINNVYLNRQIEETKPTFSSDPNKTFEDSNVFPGTNYYEIEPPEKPIVHTAEGNGVPPEMATFYNPSIDEMLSEIEAKGGKIETIHKEGPSIRLDQQAPINFTPLSNPLSYANKPNTDSEWYNALNKMKRHPKRKR